MQTKIIVVSNSKTCSFYEAKGLKITRTIQTLDFDNFITEHEKLERTGLYRKGGLPRSGFEPKTTPKVIDRDKFCAKVIEELTHLDEVSHYAEIIIAAESKVLGTLRKLIHSAQSKKVSKEVDKDLTHHSIEQVEQNVFG